MPSFLVLVGMVVNNPIMMSLITTLFGLAPLVFIPGEATDLTKKIHPRSPRPRRGLPKQRRRARSGLFIG
tara:strand:- start:1769 stop:1978 length:210 start_codon:yes stop_codon:yes gene_type:complete